MTADAYQSTEHFWLLSPEVVPVLVACADGMARKLNGSASKLAVARRGNFFITYKPSVCRQVERVSECSVTHCTLLGEN